MTDNEIIKALECCCRDDKNFVDKGSCRDCPLRNKSYCCNILRKLTLDLINRQKAEIERYRETVGKLGIKDGGVVCLLNGKETKYIDKGVAETLKRMAVKTAKAEARKEFAEKLHQELRMYGTKDKFNKAVFLNVVDKAKKELMGEDK